METPDSVAATQGIIEELFGLLGIRKVVCVDDQYAETTAVDEIIGLCSELDAGELAKIDELRDVPFDADDEVQAAVISRIWEGLELPTRRRVYSSLSSKANIEKDPKHASRLNKLLEHHDFRELSLEEWNAHRTHLLSEAERPGTLFLFDRDFSMEGGSQTQGMTLVQDVLESAPEQEVMVGLLSHTFAPNEEHDTWQTVANENGIDRNRFILISKDRLLEDPVGFARMIKLTALSSKCKELKEKVADILDGAHVEAQKRVEKISVYDFEHIVFQSSRVEGIWEPETLFRVFGLFHKARARELASENEELRMLAAAIRSVSDVPTDPTPSPEHSSWKIMRLEMYEDASYLNDAHLPLELGDIFRKNNGGKEFLLLSQPCDLMVRSDGKRHQAVSEALVAEIRNPPVGENGYPSNPDAYYKLRYYDSATGEARFVNFRSVQTVQLWILDLCVYQDDGASIYKMGEDIPANIVPAWRVHHRKIHDAAEEAINEYQKVAEDLRDKSVDSDKVALVLKHIIPQSSNGNVFKGTINPEAALLDFQFKRVGRLCQPYAADVLTKYANYHTRAAFDLDFGREI